MFYFDLGSHGKKRSSLRTGDEVQMNSKKLSFFEFVSTMRDLIRVALRQMMRPPYVRQGYKCIVKIFTLLIYAAFMINECCI